MLMRVIPPSYGAEWYEGFPVAKSFGQRYLVFLWARGDRQRHAVKLDIQSTCNFNFT